MKAEEVEEELEELEEEEKEAKSVFQSFKEKMDNLFSSGTAKEYRELLSGNVNEVRQRISEIDDPDLDALLKAEMRGKNRDTVKRFIKEQKES